MNNSNMNRACGCNNCSPCQPLEPIIMPTKVCNIVKCHPIEQPLVQFNDLFEISCVKK